MDKKLVLEDNQGQVVRYFSWSGEPMKVIRRQDTKRLELVGNTEFLLNQKIQFEEIGTVSKESLNKNPYLVGSLGHLKMIDAVENTLVDLKQEKEKDRTWYFSLLLLFVSFTTLFFSIRNMTTMSPKLEEELKQHVVKISKNIQREEIKVKPQATIKTPQSTVTAKSTTTMKRMGALSVLGSLKTGTQKGGLNLGAAQTSAGPGLGGGTQGSGGVQTSIYAKGIVGAPLGAGGNINGAGGYGTKGKGGGQAGYGNLSLVGSTGASSIPLGAEATVAKGLDRDQIAGVINRNLGQVRFCYEQGLQGNASLSGRVSVDFTIAGNGMVKAAQIESTTLNAKSIEDCIVMRLKSWKFPLPEGGVDVKVSYPFVLRRSGQG